MAKGLTLQGEVTSFRTKVRIKSDFESFKLAHIYTVNMMVIYIETLKIVKGKKTT